MYYPLITRVVFQIFFFILFSTLSTSSYCQSYEEDRDRQPSSSKLYDEAKFYYNQLQTNNSITSSRDNWLKGTRNFRRIYLSTPKSESAPLCLFMLGKMYTEMYDKFQVNLDLDESITYYKELTKLFPQHKLADDSLLALGQIFLDKRKNPQQASEYLSLIVNNYPNGDMHPEAENLLKTLSLEHDIALPKSMVSSSKENKLSYVLPVKYWSSDNYTRVVIMASGPVTYKEILLEQTENSPRRLYVDFNKSYIEPQYRAPLPIEDGLLKRIRTGQFSADTVRVVLDIESIGNYKIYSLPDPFRVVIDVHGEKHSKDIHLPTPSLTKSEKKISPKQNDSPQPPEIAQLHDHKKVAIHSKPETSPAVLTKAEKVPVGKAPSLAQQLGLGIKKIVLDPGHGGKDPGAMAFGLKEKEIVLDMAKRLAPILSKELGCEVVLTRTDDTFISLEERTALANTNNADLFVSLHINANSSSKIRGVETYFLNLSTNAEAMRVAARENATSTHQMSELQDILLDIMKNSKIDESSRLAQQVHTSIIGDSRKHGLSDIKNLGVKQAPFYVLIGAQMPAILIELAFISNEKDVENLKNSSFLEMMAKNITEGIRTYINNTTAKL